MADGVRVCVCECVLGTVERARACAGVSSRMVATVAKAGRSASKSLYALDDQPVDEVGPKERAHHGLEHVRPAPTSAVPRQMIRRSSHGAVAESHKGGVSTSAGRQR